MAVPAVPAAAATTRATAFTEPQLPSIKHFRDVGICINSIAKRRLLAEGRLFVSTSISDTSDAEDEYLRNSLGIRTVVDTAWQKEEEQHLTRTMNTALDKAPDVSEQRSWLEITRVDDRTYCGVKWRRGPYVTQLIEELSTWQKTKLYGHAFLEEPDANNALLKKVARSPGATKESLRVLGSSKAMIAELWNKVFGDETSYPILMVGNRDSCMFLIILLLFLDVPTKVISQEIQQAIEHAQGTVAAPTDEVSIKFSVDFMQSAGTWVGDVEQWLGKKYKGLDGYLAAAGVYAHAQDTAERMLLVLSGDKLAVSTEKVMGRMT
ncbi:uncharacterized protein RCC_07993 [Ramularia collo-cygni]|uniref:Uncharacterized protein n=1 Tax=Ramularia collo-cygni TaxID=112498 RepID=A0A2D3VGS7_9PEZI|nr:uncharacterized protein RCC_07993 [Ramularia collo-cygni]CZT22124.1 uncharacterized protein RCC_07993 [Ramularia collo-cygni]